MADEPKTEAKTDDPGGKYYCPGCGKRTDDKDDVCTGGEFTHAPLAVVSTSELSGSPDKHTPAPNTGEM